MKWLIVILVFGMACTTQADRAREKALRSRLDAKYSAQPSATGPCGTQTTNGVRLTDGVAAEQVESSAECRRLEVYRQEVKNLEEMYLTACLKCADRGRCDEELRRLRSGEARYGDSACTR